MDIAPKKWNIEDNNKGKESLFDKIKNIFKQGCKYEK